MSADASLLNVVSLLVSFVAFLWTSVMRASGIANQMSKNQPGRESSTLVKLLHLLPQDKKYVMKFSKTFMQPNITCS